MRTLLDRVLYLLKPNRQYAVQKTICQSIAIV